MNEAIKKEILEAIKKADKIVISRHLRPDGDAIGSSRGLAALLRASFPEKDIRVCGDDSSDYLAFLGPDDPHPSEAHYRESLLIVTDTGNEGRISNQYFSLAPRVIKIDHHIPDQDHFGHLAWVEPERSSCCEMIADFYRSFPNDLKLTREAALLLYTGMVTDSGRFRFPSVSGDTLRLAGMLLDTGLDTESLFARLGLREADSFRYEAYVYEHMKFTPNGVAYLFVDGPMQQRFSLSREDASETISYLSEIKGSLIWLAFIDNGDGSIRVRLRSRFVTVQELATRYHGGGHDRASGATVYSWEEAEQLLAEADELLKNYKENHEGWL